MQGFYGPRTSTLTIPMELPSLLLLPLNNDTPSALKTHNNDQGRPIPLLSNTHASAGERLPAQRQPEIREPPLLVLGISTQFAGQAAFTGKLKQWSHPAPRGLASTLQEGVRGGQEPQ